MSSTTTFAPPPRRAVPPAGPSTPPLSSTTASLPVTPSDPTSSDQPASTWSSRWRARSADWGKKAYEKSIYVSDVVGVRVNDFSEKRLGTEGFWPVTDDFPQQMEKAARILKAFTVDGLVTVEKPKEDDNDKDEEEEPEDEEDFSLLDDKTRKQKEKERAKKLKEKEKAQAKKNKKPRQPLKVVRKIPPKVIANCKGLCIFTSMRSGIAPFGGAGGAGIVVAKLPDGRWSAPASIMPGNLTAGFLIGVDIYDCILVIRSQKALDSFATHKATLGTEIGVTAGPFGAGAAVEAGIEASPVFSYVRSRGLYAGVEVVGQVFFERSDENAKMYHWPGVKAGDILAGKVNIPPEAANLHKALMDAETGRAQGEHLDAMLQEGIQELVLNEGETLRLPPTPDMTNGTEQTEDPETVKVHYPTRPGSFIDGAWPAYFFNGKAKAGPPPLPQRRSLPLDSAREADEAGAVGVANGEVNGVERVGAEEVYFEENVFEETKKGKESED